MPEGCECSLASMLSYDSGTDTLTLKAKNIILDSSPEGSIALNGTAKVDTLNSSSISAGKITATTSLSSPSITATTSLSSEGTITATGDLTLKDSLVFEKDAVSRCDKGLIQVTGNVSGGSTNKNWPLGVFVSYGPKGTDQTHAYTFGSMNYGCIANYCANPGDDVTNTNKCLSS